jgi:tRNA(fMet)-specific endonuclease VapC
LAVILADTDVLIDYLWDIAPVAQQIASYLRADQLLTTAISCFELLSGAEKGKRRDKTLELIDSIVVLPFDLPAAQRAAEVRRYLDRTGQPIGMGDSLIAGTALIHHLSLFTRNRSHFERVPDLTLVAVEGPRPKQR